MADEGSAFDAPNGIVILPALMQEESEVTGQCCLVLYPQGSYYGTRNAAVASYP